MRPTARHRPAFRTLVVLCAALLFAAACGGGDEPLSRAEAEQRVRELADDIEWRNEPVTRRANVEAIGTTALEDTLPPISEFPIVVDAQEAGNVEVVEVFASTEKSGEGTDGWMVEATQAFNASSPTLADGTPVQVRLRKIASGVGYQFLAARGHLPDAFTPSNDLWVRMAEATGLEMTLIDDQLVANVAGIVLKDATAESIEADYGDVTPKSLIEAVSRGDLVMGYTDPFASSTGLNYLVTVLDQFADGDEVRMLEPDVVSAFEEFQRNVPFVALTTIQMRDSVERAEGTLDAFVMEWQTFVNTEALRKGYTFVPFGVRHDNPLYAVGDIDDDTAEALEVYATFLTSGQQATRAEQLGFDPPAYEPTTAVHSGETLIEAQKIWKEKKDGGRPVVAMFVADVSGSMAGGKISALRESLTQALDFVSPTTSVGLITFDDVVRLRVPIDEFDLNHRGAFTAAVEDMTDGGSTAMYDAVIVALAQLLEAEASIPGAKPMVLVLTDGEVTEGLSFESVSSVVEGLGIPVYTVGYDANLDELGRLSTLVEAASLNATEADVAYKLGQLFNAEL